MSLIDTFSLSLITQVSKAVIKGPKKIKVLFLIILIIIISAIIIVILTDLKLLPYYWNMIAGGLGIVGGLGILSIYSYQVVIEDSEAREEIKKVEERVKEHPHETSAAWELARIKLENYLNKNLSQINWIFFLTVLVMFVGFCIIGYGIFKVYQPNTDLKAGIITTTSGIIVDFIGATFLIIYKSTMGQAKDLINVLERINAVGMSVQISDRIENNSDLKDITRAEIAKLLLNLYNIKDKKATTKKAKS